MACRSPTAAAAFAVLGLAACARTDVPLYGNLGSLHRNVTTRSAEAQRYFDQGLRLTYAFNHGEAIRSFTRATELDPSCAMCWWGIALAAGPNINWPMDPAGEAQALAAVGRARDAAAAASEVERALIEALAERYGAPPMAERAARDSAYARAMRGVAGRFPDDVDAAVLFADATMNLSPWFYWTPEGAPRPGTDDLLAALDRARAAAPDHPGACHFYIHAVETWYPERALPCAERLAELMPGAGHLVHMPAHIYFRLGRYDDAIEHNRHGAHADEAFFERRGPQGVYAALYYPHNYHFLSVAAAMAGRRAEALEAADRTLGATGWNRMRELPPLELFGPARVVTLARFGMWEAILRDSAPPADLHYTRGMWRHARGLAYAHTQRPDSAAAERAALAADSAALPADAVVGFNPPQRLLGIAALVLDGTIAARAGRTADAVRALQRAIGAQDSLIYDEPPPFYFPVRETLGEVLLAGRRPRDAEAVFREDLRRNPGNGRSLAGLREALRAQGRPAAADSADAQFRRAWARADVTITTSRF
jgi:tetratricopeptide (TPR) repeat protein